MKVKNSRLEALKTLISSNELGNQEDVLRALRAEGFTLTQATLSRDLKQLKVAKAAGMNGKYVYVLPSETMYKRLSMPNLVPGMSLAPGFMSLNFSNSIGVIRTRPGYASAIAYNIDNSNVDEIIGTLAGDDTIFIAIKEGVSKRSVTKALELIVQGLK